jgi:hypothetical protein
LTRGSLIAWKPGKERTRGRGIVVIDSFSSDFAERYGLRDGLILSGICAISTGGGDVGAIELRRRYYYLTVMQIRRALENLTREGALTRERDGGFSREFRYRAAPKCIRSYLQDIDVPRIPSRKGKDGKGVAEELTAGGL